MNSDVDPLLQDASAKLADFSASFSLNDVPDSLREHVRHLIVDALGCCLQGARLPWTRHVTEMVLAEGCNPVATLIASGEKVSISQAALVNSTAGHAFEMDDIHRDSIIHGGSLVTPVALAFGEARPRMSGKNFMECVIAGYEIGTRVGAGASQSLLLNGFHPQGTTGTIAAGAAAAKALNLNSQQTLHALGTAASQSAGLMAAQEGAMVKRFHSGRAAQSGVYGALLAERGFTGIEDFVEAPYGGFLASFSSDPRPERVLDGLGVRWETADVGYKPFAAVTSIHTCLEALASIMSQHELNADDIQSIQANVSQPTYLHCAWPYTGQSVTAAQMNLYFGLAVMALDGAAFVEQYTQARLHDPKILELIERIEAVSDTEINARGPEHRHNARVVVTTTHGSEYERTVTIRKGSPDNPLSHAEVLAKFRSNAGTVLSIEAIDELLDTVMKLEGLDDIRAITRLLVAE